MGQQSMEFTCTFTRAPGTLAGITSRNKAGADGRLAAHVFCSNASGWKYDVVEENEDDVKVRFIGPDLDRGQTPHPDSDHWAAALAGFGVKVAE